MLSNRSIRPEVGEWWHIAPIGEWPHRDTGKLQVIDAAACFAMEEDLHSHPRKILVDQEHFSYNSNKSSEALGWIDELESRPDGLWGRAALTDIGEAAVSNGRYRFLSPVWLAKDLQVLGGGRVRPLRLDSVGLTNVPNLCGTPLFNARPGGIGNAREEIPQLAAARSWGWLANRRCVTMADLVMEYQKERGLSWDKAWNEFTLGAGAGVFGADPKLANRAMTNLEAAFGSYADAPYIDTADLLAKAVKVEDKVFKAIEEKINKNAAADPGLLYPETYDVRANFRRTLERLMRRGPDSKPAIQNAMTLRQAWEHLRSTSPVFFARAVLQPAEFE